MCWRCRTNSRSRSSTDCSCMASDSGGTSWIRGCPTLFLTARALLARRRTDNAAKAVALFEQIIAADPAFAPAYAGTCQRAGCVLMATPSTEAPPPDPRMRPAALAGDRDRSTAGRRTCRPRGLYARDRNWDFARASFATAMKMDPTLTTAHADFVLVRPASAWRNGGGAACDRGGTDEPSRCRWTYAA